MGIGTRRMIIAPRFRKISALFILAVFLLIFHVSLSYYYPKTVGLSYPNLCENGSCQLKPSQQGMTSSTLRNEEANPDNMYLVNTSGCKLIAMDPFHPSAAKLFKPRSSFKCDHRIAQVQGDQLILDTEYLQKFTLGSVSCCYRGIYRVAQSPTNYDHSADNQTRFSEECQHLPTTPEGITVEGSPFVKLECNGTDKIGKNRKDVEFHGIPLYPKKHSEETRKKAEYWEERKAKGLKNPMSILVIGIDSTSRLHMIRSMPKTREFLLQNDFVELKGYTKIGENTFPNVMAGFGGMELNNYSSCWPNQSTKLDDCPFVWKDFSKLNYMTGFLEDFPRLAIFNYGKVGFVVPPADYYLRPLAIAVYRHFRGQRLEFCAGGVNVIHFMTKFIRELVVKMGSNFPYFFFSWLTSFAHEDFNALTGLDETYLKLFKATMDNSMGDPDNTVIIFMSDHGYRNGRIRQSFLGFYEDSLPFFYFRLPPSLKTKHPEWYSNLMRNRNKLSSPLDLHSTLLQILSVAQGTISSNDDLPESEMRQMEGDNFNKQRYSFFERIPDSRTCEVSAIPERYCMCGVTPTVSSESGLSSSQMGKELISRINLLLRNNSDICQPLEFSKFLYGRELGSGQFRNTSGQVFNYKKYVLAVESVPGEGHFESKIRVFPNSSIELLGNIQRINRYAGQSDCVKDLSLKSFCYCKDIDKKKRAG